MSLIFGHQKRSISYQDVWGSGGDWSTFSADKALSLVPVYAATRFLADSVSSLPIRAYRQAGEAREPVELPPLFTTPCSYGTVYDWWHRCMTSLLLRGNAYGLIAGRDRVGYPSMVHWVHPDSVSVDETGAVPAYTYQGRPVPSDAMIHVVAYALPGRFVGLSPVSAFKMTMETGYRAQEATRDWYKRAGRPMGHLKNTAKTLRAEEAATAKDRFRSTVKDGDVMVTGSDWDLKPITLSAQDAQFLAAIKATATQVASIYGVSPERIGGDSGKSMTYSTVEGDTLHELTWAVRPWLVRLEHVFTKLMVNSEFVRFNADAMIRVDLKSRYEAHEISLRNDWQTINEVRALEDRAPVPWGDEPRPKAEPAVAQRDEPSINVDARTEVTIPERVTTVENHVDARTDIHEGAIRSDVTVPVDATTALTEDSIRVDVAPVEVHVDGASREVRRRVIERDANGEMTAIVEER